MPFVSEYKCTGCEQITPREDLMAVRVSFRLMGDYGRTVKSRVVGWLCPDCLGKHPVWLDQSPSAVHSTALVRRKIPKPPPPPPPMETRSVAPIEPREEDAPVAPFII